MKNKILIINDLHLTDFLPYNSYVEEGREKEKKEILDFLVDKSNDCDTVIFGGDSLDKKNNSSAVIKEFTEFLERFDNKKLFILSGNHEKKPDGSSAVDYLKEIRNKNWSIVTNSILIDTEIDFCPYFSKSELGVKNNEEGQKLVMSQLEGNKILIVHYAISDSMTRPGQNTNLFDEIVLPRKELLKRYGLIIGAHIHRRSFTDNVLVTGSVFSREVNEGQKYIHKIDANTLEVEKIKLPGRQIIKLENPANFNGIPENSIVKVLITDTEMRRSVSYMKKDLERFDGSLLIEQYPRIRKKEIITNNKDVRDISVEDLLKIYSENRKVPLRKLISAFNLIKE